MTVVGSVCGLLRDTDEHGEDDDLENVKKPFENHLVQICRTHDIGKERPVVARIRVSVPSHVYLLPGAGTRSTAQVRSTPDWNTQIILHGVKVLLR